MSEADKEIPTKILVAMPSRKLSAAQRRHRQEARLAMIRQWWASGFPVAKVRRMARTIFQIKDDRAQALLEQVVQDIEDEAEIYEQIPAHIIKHRHRVRLEHFYRWCIAEGHPSPAERALRMLATMDGVFEVRTDDMPTLVVPISQQGARMLDDDELMKLLQSKGDQTVTVDVPMAEEVRRIESE